MKYFEYNETSDSIIKWKIFSAIFIITVHFILLHLPTIQI